MGFMGPSRRLRAILVRLFSNQQELRIPESNSRDAT